MESTDTIIARISGVIEACEEIRTTESEALGEHAMIVAYLHIKEIMEGVENV